ncbi:MAG: tRNA uridine-5-carboxymethylaminomethyl(34) synthesis GTPase MnmE [Robiginitomaculum sp.]
MNNAYKIGDSDTIFALASAQGRAGVSIMRISGPESAFVVQGITNRSLPSARKAILRKLKNNKGEIIDEALLIFFKGPASFTGEDMVEFHTHGSIAVIENLSCVLFSLGLRQADPGEFTRRAFQNGKMDFTEAEGLADLIDAETEGQRKQALRQMQGGLKNEYENWRNKILDSLAYVEGEIDFPDEDDVPDALAQRAGPGLDSLLKTLDLFLKDSDRGSRVRHGVDIAIIGAPNVGKSSLLNKLARRDAAIVSPQAGTTRDIVEVYLNLSGLSVRVSDTAGLRDAQDSIEAEGMRRTHLRANEADLRIAVIDSFSPDLSVLETLCEGDFIVYNKDDLVEIKPNLNTNNVSRETFVVSVKTGSGVDELEMALEKYVNNRFGISELAGLTRARHVTCVRTARECIENAYGNLSYAPELSGADLRSALHAIKELAGETDIESVLDRVFSSFCIGK